MKIKSISLLALLLFVSFLFGNRVFAQISKENRDWNKEKAEKWFKNGWQMVAKPNCPNFAIIVIQITRSWQTNSHLTLANFSNS